MCWDEWRTSGLIKPFANKMAMPLRAREHVTRRRSHKMEMVIILYFGTSARSLSYVDCCYQAQHVFHGQSSVLRESSLDAFVARDARREL